MLSLYSHHLPTFPILDPLGTTKDSVLDPWENQIVLFTCSHSFQMILLLYWQREFSSSPPSSFLLPPSPSSFPLPLLPLPPPPPSSSPSSSSSSSSSIIFFLLLFFLLLLFSPLPLLPLFLLLLLLFSLFLLFLFLLFSLPIEQNLLSCYIPFLFYPYISIFQVGSTFFVSWNCKPLGSALKIVMVLVEGEITEWRNVLNPQWTGNTEILHLWKEF